MSTRSLRGYKYFVTFIDNYSRKNWIYFLKAKGEVFNHFKEFKTLVENAIGKKIKMLHLDNKGEYAHSDFMGFCSKEGIRRE